MFIPLRFRPIKTPPIYRVALGALLLASGVFSIAFAGSPPNDLHAARQILDDVHRHHPFTFYCECPFRDEVPDLLACSYKVRKRQDRATRIEWDHIVPASTIGKSIGCWHGQRRDNCLVTSERYRAAILDPHNLQPSVGEINADRSDFIPGNIAGDILRYGKCDFEVDFTVRTFEPQPMIRGDIARTYFYMEEKYNVSISIDLKNMLFDWSKKDPVSDWERLRNQLIFERTGEFNRFIETLPTR